MALKIIIRSNWYNKIIIRMVLENGDYWLFDYKLFKMIFMDLIEFFIVVNIGQFYLMVLIFYWIYIT